MAAQFAFDAIGTHWIIDIHDALSSDQEKVLFDTINQRIEVFDKTYSRFRSDSLVTEISKKAGVYSFPEDAEKLFAIYQDMYELTEGKVTPLIGEMLVDAGYDASYSLTQKKPLEQSKKWEAVMTYHHPVLTTQLPVLLDFGAAGKGYLVDIVGALLQNNNCTEYMIDAGGDILHKTVRSENVAVALEHPLHIEQAIGVAYLSNKSLCGSAGNRRTWGDFHHIMNPHTKESTKDVLATWVIADTTMLADALATCLFFISPETIEKKYVCDYIVLHADFSIQKSKSFPGELFSA